MNQLNEKQNRQMMIEFFHWLISFLLFLVVNVYVRQSSDKESKNEEEKNKIGDM